MKNKNLEDMNYSEMIEEMLENILAEENSNAMDIFNTILESKLTNALEERKIEIVENYSEDTSYIEDLSENDDPKYINKKKVKLASLNRQIDDHKNRLDRAVEKRKMKTGGAQHYQSDTEMKLSSKIQKLRQDHHRLKVGDIWPENKSIFEDIGDLSEESFEDDGRMSWNDWRNKAKKLGAVKFKDTDTHTHAYDKDGNKISSIKWSSKNDIKESFEDLSEDELMELSKSTLASYIKKAHRSGNEASFRQPYSDVPAYQSAVKRENKRKMGIDKAVNRLAKEDYEIDERVINPYAIGMSIAKKKAGITSAHAEDLPKKVIKTGHDIAKKIEKQ